jgi:carbon storage regulator
MVLSGLARHSESFLPIGTILTVVWHADCTWVRDEGNSVSRVVVRPRNGSRSFGLEPRNQEGIMLVLSRKPGQSVRLANDIRITLVRIEGQTIRIGIEAPEEVGIRRQEIAFEVPESFAGKPAVE